MMPNVAASDGQREGPPRGLRDRERLRGGFELSRRQGPPIEHHGFQIKLVSVENKRRIGAAHRVWPQGQAKASG